VHRLAAAVDRDGDRHVLDLELADRLHAEVLEGDQPRGLDGLGDQVGRAADGHQVHRAVALDGLDGVGPRSALPIMPIRPGLAEHLLGELVHARGRGRAGGADHLVAHRVHGADVVDEAVGQIDAVGQRLAAVEQVLDALVGGVAAGQQLAREQQALAGLPGRRCPRG
jgi:hypothetical protein